MSIVLQKTLLRKNNQKSHLNLKAIDLFAGIGGIRIGFQKAFDNKIDFVFSSEIDIHAQKTYMANFHEKPTGDITKVKEENIPEHNILLAGFPCQAFSIAGLRKGFEDTRGTLFFDVARIVSYHKPEVIFLENVKGFKSHDKGNTFRVVKSTLEKLGYKVYCEILNAKNYGLPQNRERIYIVAFLDNSIKFDFPEALNKITTVGEILDKSVNDKYTISDRLWQGHQRRKEMHKQKGNGFGYSMFTNESEYTSTISARYYKDGSEILIYQENKNPRKLTPREAARLQGFPEDFYYSTSETQAYKQFGNSVAIPVVEAIATNIKKAILQYS